MHPPTWVRVKAIDWSLLRSAATLSFETPGGRFDPPARACYEKCPARASINDLDRSTSKFDLERSRWVQINVS